MTHILCIDIGTSRVKTAIIDETGVLRSLYSERIDRTNSPDSQDVTIWRNIVLQLLRDMKEDFSKYPP